MRRAWADAAVQLPHEQARAGMLAFKANWREARRLGAALRRCFDAWRAAARRGKKVRTMAKPLKEVCGRAPCLWGSPTREVQVSITPAQSLAQASTWSSFSMPRQPARSARPRQLSPATDAQTCAMRPQACQRRTKVLGLSAFLRFACASQLIAAAGAARLARFRVLALCALCAWRGDRLKARWYLLWQRWRGRAVARLRLRAFLAAHMARWGGR